MKSFIHHFGIDFRTATLTSIASKVVFCILLFSSRLFGQLSPCDNDLQCVSEIDQSQFHCLLGNSVDALIKAHLLEPFPQCTSKVQKVVIPASLTVDVPEYWFAPGSEIIVLGSDNGGSSFSGTIHVLTGSTLVLSGTHVHGCQALYQGIVVDQAGTLVTNSNTIIEDACTAIFQVPGANLHCTSTTFDGNFIGIHALGGVGATTIGGCTFSGAKTLLSQVTNNPVLGSPATPTYKPTEGIRVDNVPMYVIGIVNTEWI